jgi:hypothetical protein
VMRLKTHHSFEIALVLVRLEEMAKIM